MQHGMVTTDYGFSTARRGWPVAPDGEDPLQQSSSTVWWRRAVWGPDLLLIASPLIAAVSAIRSATPPDVASAATEGPSCLRTQYHCIGMFSLHSRSPAMDGHHPLGDISNTCNCCEWPNREGSNIQENNLGTILSRFFFYNCLVSLAGYRCYHCVYMQALLAEKKQSLIVSGGKPAIRKMPRVQLLTTVSNQQVSATLCTALLNTVFCIQSINRTINYTYIAKAFLSRQYSNISFEWFVLLYIWFV